MKTKVLFPLLLLVTMGFKQGEKQVQETVENFSLVNAIDNNQVALSDFSKSKAVVIVFNSPTCAFCKIYDDRLVSLAHEFEGKEVKFVFINPNNPTASPQDNADIMAKRAKEKGYFFPYLIDATGRIAAKLGATKTPEAYVLKPVKESFVVKYKGAIDDNPQLASEVNSYYLKDAINAVLANAPVKISEKKATGCMIKR